MEDNTEKKKGKKKIKIIFIILISGVVLLIGAAIAVTNENLLRPEARELYYALRDKYQKKFGYPSHPMEIFSGIVLAEKLYIVEKLSDGSESIEGEPLFEPVSYLPFGIKVEIDLNNPENYLSWRGLKYKLVSIGGREYQKIDYKRNDDYFLAISSLDELAKSEYAEDILYTFPNEESQQLAVPYKRAILDYLDNNDEFGNYAFTQDPYRIKKAIIISDIDETNEQMAVILEDKYNRNSVLLVFIHNKKFKITSFSESYSADCLSIIHSFEKGTKIFINSENLIKAPNPGMIYELLGDEETKYAIFYNPKTMRFERYEQKPLSEIQSNNEPDYEFENKESEYE